ncbi:hypothetical protein C7212DRAFT_366000 [Tuber magnatum]|uniref:C2H2-type domain-containing protein n=1 Tax=Tuber magnatum TaxID=42249 RepID=A0A317SFY0_9PEZI|nr:hypothetical protein C7212DRAFT_366000 [Tuber magnatum]
MLLPIVISMCTAPLLVLPATIHGLEIVPSMEKIHGKNEDDTGADHLTLRVLDSLLGELERTRESWHGLGPENARISGYSRHHNADTIQLPPSLILCNFNHPYTPTPQVPHYTAFISPAVIFSRAVAILANTASLICSTEEMSGIQGWVGSGVFAVLRNLELLLSWFRGQMRGTLRLGSAMTSHSVYEVIFVSGICYPQLANPPICKLHHPSDNAFRNPKRPFHLYRPSRNRKQILGRPKQMFTSPNFTFQRGNRDWKQSSHLQDTPHPSRHCKSIPLTPMPSHTAMGSMQSPPSFTDIDDIFDSLINKDCLLSEVPDILNSQKTTFRDNLLQQQQQQLHLQELSPPSTPKQNDAQPHPYFALEFSESHFLSTKTTDLPPWADPTDLFNFDLVPVNDLLATPAELPPQVPGVSMQSTPVGSTMGSSPQSLAHYILPPTPLSLPSSTTTSPAPAAPLPPAPLPPPPPTGHSTLTPTPAATAPTTAPIPSPRPRPKPHPKKAFACTSIHCHPTTTTENPETTHHHHHKDPKRRFCCRSEDCTSCTSYTTRKDRNRHEMSKHSDQHLVCDICGHKTAREDNMRVHVRAAHEEGWEMAMKRIMGVRMKMVLGLP